jgi:hypothetical protein
MGSAGASTSEAVVSSPALSQPLDFGPVMLRCAGPDDVFGFGEGSDDLVYWATPVEPVDLTKATGTPYLFKVLPPFGERCRVYRSPFPAGVEPPPPPESPPPEPSTP